jgi:hypothetical protein
MALPQLKEERFQKFNWIGGGGSLVWIAFFIVCMFIRTNFPATSFAVRFLTGVRVFWTLAGSFVVILVLATGLSALVDKIKHRASGRH